VLRSGPILGLGDHDLRLLLDVHLIAAFRLLRVIGAYWRAEAKAARAVDAAVVLTTSSAGLYGFRAEVAYSAAKAAVAMLSRIGAGLGRHGRPSTPSHPSCGPVSPDGWGSAPRTRPMTPWPPNTSHRWSPGCSDRGPAT
jgi:hypothetical protein